MRNLFGVVAVALIAAICFEPGCSENIVGEVMGNQLLRSPVAVILQITQEAIYQMKTLLRNEALPKRDIIFYAVHGPAAQEGKPTTVQQLSDLLNNFHDEPDASTAPTLSSATAALNKLPFDSAVILAVSSTPSDLDLVDRFTDISIRQRARLYVIWAGRDDVSSKLREMALKTGGAVYNAITNSVTRERKLRINPDMVGRNQSELGDDGQNNEMYDDDDVLFDEETDPETETQSFPADVSDFARIKREQVLAEVAFPDDEKKHNDTNLSIVTMGQQKSAVTIPIVVELASGSNLEIRPGAVAQLTFDVINNINQMSSVSFIASGVGIAIQSIQPSAARLLPLEMIKIQVSFAVLPQTGGTGKISFTASGIFGRITRSANFYVTTTPTIDTWEPELTYQFKGDCRQFDKPGNCENGQWSLEAVFKDPDSGLLKILSEPMGLLFSTEFIAGTKSPVTVTYLASCCKPKVDIWAEDLKGNFRRKSFDVFHPVLQDGEIAAIVVGIVLLIVIIVLIVICILYCRKRKTKWDVVLPRRGSK